MGGISIQSHSTMVTIPEGSQVTHIERCVLGWLRLGEGYQIVPLFNPNIHRRHSQLLLTASKLFLQPILETGHSLLHCIIFFSKSFSYPFHLTHAICGSVVIESIAFFEVLWCTFAFNTIYQLFCILATHIYTTNLHNSPVTHKHNTTHG